MSKPEGEPPRFYRKWNPIVMMRAMKSGAGGKGKPQEREKDTFIY
jgi:hypothetical protein